MSLFLAMDPLEFILRYTVITGIVFAIIGTAICMTAKRATMAKRKQVEISKNDKFYTALICLGIMFILVGMIIMVLPIEVTFYRG